MFVLLTALEKKPDKTTRVDIFCKTKQTKIKFKIEQMQKG